MGLVEEDGQENLCVEGSVTCIGTSIVVVHNPVFPGVNLGFKTDLFKKHTVQAMGELTPAVVVLTQRQNHLPPTTLLGPPLTRHGRRYHSGHGSSKRPVWEGIEPGT